MTKTRSTPTAGPAGSNMRSEQATDVGNEKQQRAFAPFIRAEPSPGSVQPFRCSSVQRVPANGCEAPGSRTVTDGCSGLTESHKLWSPKQGPRDARLFSAWAR